jgi:pilus assembly protein Flp/PilA
MNMLQNLIARLTGGQFADLSVLRREDGQTLVEYALILFLIAITVVVIVGTLGTQVSSVFNSVVNTL